MKTRLGKRKGALFSACENYRYALWRNLPGTKRPVTFIMLNPSTADAEKDDPTVRRCIGYATEWGHDILYVGNIFAYRATDPKVLRRKKEPQGVQTDFYLLDMAKQSELVIAAWGNHGDLNNRGRDVCTLMRMAGIELYALRILKTGQPSHPLYLPKNLKPKRWYG